MKKVLFILLLSVASLGAARAQEYNWAMGMRMGADTGSFSARYKFSPAIAVEALFASYWNEGFTVAALYERFIPVIGAHWNIYYGAGAHVGEWNKKFSLGADAILGLEYKLPRSPIAFSADYKPGMNLMSKADFMWSDWAVGVRVTF